MVKNPCASAVSSNVAFSDSISAIISSISTKSPSSLDQAPIVTSVMDSPTVGTTISKVLPVRLISLPESDEVSAASDLLSSTGIAVLLAFSSIVPTISPMPKVAPSLANCFNAPATSAFNSKVAFSDSNSQIGSSKATIAPSSTNHCPSVTSVMDSPTPGIFISKLIVCIFLIGECPIYNFLLLLMMYPAEACGWGCTWWPENPLIHISSVFS